MKITGTELLAFMEHAWPGDDWYWSHELFDDTPDPDATYDTDEIGGILYQGWSDDPTGGDGYDLAVLIRKWRKARDFDVMTINVPKGRTDEVREALSAIGIKV